MVVLMMQDPRRHGRNALMELFMRADADGSGELDRDEFRSLLRSLELDIGAAELEKMIDECSHDLDGDSSFAYRHNRS
jgi:Ca2+-binding EF-hand superfamily protein